MDTKYIHCMLEDMSKYGKEMISCAVGNGKVNLDDAGKIIDIVKDLAEAEYHALISKEMRKAHEGEEFEEEFILSMLKEHYGDKYDEEKGKRFYDRYRYSNGRFAPKGRGRRMGYSYPDYHIMPEYDRDMDIMDGRMYYPEIQGSSDGSNRGTVDWGGRSSRYGYSYDNYMQKRKEYSKETPSGKQERMKLMEDESSEIINMISDIMDDVSLEEKNILKNKLTKLINGI